MSSSINSPANKGYAMALGQIRSTEKRTKSRSKRSTKGSKHKTIKGIKRRNNKGKIRKVTKCVRSKTSSKGRLKKSTKHKGVSKKQKTVRRRIKDVFK